MTDRPSLRDPALSPVWDAVRARLERSGLGNRGRIRTPKLTSRGERLLTAVLDAPVRAMVDLGALEARLEALGIGATLCAAIAVLGHPVSETPALRRADRSRAAEVRAVARRVTAGWPEPLAGEWIDEVIRSGLLAGLDEVGATELLDRVRAILDRIGNPSARGTPDSGASMSRIDLAAEVLGSSHGLDRGTREEAALTRLFRRWYPGENDRRVWERAGVLPDRVSAPVLTWGLSMVGRLGRSEGSGVSELLGLATELSVPLHLSQMALRAYPVEVDRGADVLVAENPRIVEAAAEAATPFAVVALNGNPAGAARLLIDQLLGGGARLRYHGDFDAAGLAICGRMHRLGLEPWRMDSASYEAAVAEAELAGAQLPSERRRAPETPWDPLLQAEFDRLHRVVHEERLLPGLLDLREGPSRCAPARLVHSSGPPVADGGERRWRSEGSNCEIDRPIA